MIKATIIDSTQAQYTAKEFSWLQDLIMTSGYFASQAGVRTFDVAENASPNMGVQIKAGKILVPFSKGGIDWKIICETTGESLVTPANATGSNRVDAVIVKIDTVNDPNTLKTNIVTPQYITGTGVSALSDGAITAIIGAGYSFVRLANITVPNGASSVTNAMIAQLLTKVSISPSVDINPASINYTLSPAPFLSSDAVFDTDVEQVQSTQNGFTEIGEANVTSKKNLLAQSFIPAKTKIRGVKLFKQANTGTYTGDITVSLQADIAGSPSGSNLASGVIPNAIYNALAVGEFDALFTTEYTMTLLNTYWIVVTSSTSDTSNHPNLGSNTAGGYASGVTKYKNTTDGWVLLSGLDLYFKTLQGIIGQVGSPLVQVFTVNGTYYKPPLAKVIDVICIGAGGGGCGGANNNGSGGGGGAMRRFAFPGASISATVAITVPQETAQKTIGGNSSFGSYLIAYGGGTSYAPSTNTGGCAGGGGGGVLGAGGTNPGAASPATSPGGAPAFNVGNNTGGGGAYAILASGGSSAEYGGGGGGGANYSSGYYGQAGGNSAYGGGGGGCWGNNGNGNGGNGGGGAGGTGTGGMAGVSCSGSGLGGGGGAPNTAGIGGHGGTPGGGGGGGSTGGGLGGRGEVIVITYF